MCFCFKILRPPVSTRSDTLLPYTTLFRSGPAASGAAAGCGPFGRILYDPAPAPGTNRRVPVKEVLHSNGKVHHPHRGRRPPAAGQRLHLHAHPDAVPEHGAAHQPLQDAALISEEHTSELPALLLSSYVVLGLTKNQLTAPHVTQR